MKALDTVISQKRRRSYTMSSKGILYLGTQVLFKALSVMERLISFRIIVWWFDHTRSSVVTQANSIHNCSTVNRKYLQRVQKAPTRTSHCRLARGSCNFICCGGQAKKHKTKQIWNGRAWWLTVNFPISAVLSFYSFAAWQVFSHGNLKWDKLYFIMEIFYFKDWVFWRESVKRYGTVHCQYRTGGSLLGPFLVNGWLHHNCHEPDVSSLVWAEWQRTKQNDPFSSPGQG